MCTTKVFFVTFCLFGIFAISIAWKPATRCDAGISGRPKRSIEAVEVPVEDDIPEIAKKQQQALTKKYKDIKFVGVPLIAESFKDKSYEVYVAQSCSFVTPLPSPISSIRCEAGIPCKLTHSVASTETFATADSFNWGAKISAKIGVGLPLTEKLLEIGGEASYGQSYTCTYTQAKTTTDAVECTGPVDKASTLELYNIQSYIKCSTGRVLYERVMKDPADVKGLSDSAKRIFRDLGIGPSYDRPFADGDLSDSDVAAILDAKAVTFPDTGDKTIFLLDVDKITERVLAKIREFVPEYDPYTDVFVYEENTFSANTLKIAFFGNPTPFSTAYVNERIPFTNDDGNAVYQYACVLA